MVLQRTRRIVQFTSLAIALSAAGVPCLAAETSGFDFSGAIRLRQASLWGQYRPGLPASDDQLALRSTLHVEWTGGGWKLVGEMMDSRTWENDDGGVLTNSDVNVFEPIQAYVARRFDGAFGEGSSASVQFGRSTLNLGSRRLIASDDYGNTTNSYTGLRTDLAFADKTQMNLFYVLPQRRLPGDAASLRDADFHLDREGREQQLRGFFIAKPGLLPGGTLAEFGYVGYKESDRAGYASRNRDLHNFSLRAIRDPKAGAWDYEAEGIYQTGQTRSGTAVAATELDVEAFFVHADAGYTFTARGKPRLSAEFDYASGDGPEADYQHFDTLFGSRRGEYAPAGIYGLLGRANLQMLGLRLEATPSARLDYFATWHALWAADRHDSFATSGIRDAAGASGRYAGQQFDGRVRYWILPKTLRAEVNAAWFLRGGLMRNAPNAPPENTKYVSVAVTYSF